ncbi:MAG: fumarylacetoacetate hydrolase family protein [Natronomonas sp.]
MKLATFEFDQPTGTASRVGVVDGDANEYLDVTAGYATILAGEGHQMPHTVAEAIAPPEMRAFLEAGDDAMEAAAAVLELDDRIGVDGVQIRYGPDEVSLKSPLPRPRKIRDFSVFEDHGREKSEDWYEYPAYYNGNPDCVVDPGSVVEAPPYTDLLDYELEVAAVIGREGRNVERDEADAYIAGYTIFNDFSARDIQVRQGLSPGKGKDFANGFGPYLVTADEFPVDSATMVARVDGEEWSRGSLADMYHSWGDLVEYASWGETIYPGDVLGSGTIGGGCGADLGQYFDPGAEIELEVEGIGTLRHGTVDTR